MKMLIAKLAAMMDSSINEVRMSFSDADQILDAMRSTELKLSCKMGVGDGSGELFVHGGYNAIKSAQQIVIERDELKVEIANRDETIKFLKQDVEGLLSKHANLYIALAAAESKLAELEKQEPVAYTLIFHGMNTINIETTFSSFEKASLYSQWCSEPDALVKNPDPAPKVVPLFLCAKPTEAVQSLTDEQIKHIRERAELNSNNQVDLVKFARDIESAIRSQPVDAKPKEGVDQAQVIEPAGIYKGHPNLADMIKHHIPNWRGALQSEMEGLHDPSWFQHELKALSEIEKAVDYDLSKVTTKPQRITEQYAREIIGSFLDSNTAYLNWKNDHLPALLAKLNEHREPELAVWYGPMPESNGKENYTAILYRKNKDGFLGGIGDGITIDRSEYPDRVRYEADRMRYMIGELGKEPFILDYDSEKHTGYVEQVTANKAEVQENPILTFIEVAHDLIDEHPYLYVEIARTRQTDWMVWLRKKPNGDLIANGQGLTVAEACTDALNSLPPLKDGAQ